MMTTIFSILFFAIGMIAGFFLYSKTVITVTDRFKPNKNRTDEQIKNDAVLQLSNDIAKSGALETTELPNGYLRVNLKIVKR